MKFREYGEVKPVTVTAKSPEELDSKIEELGEENDIIDLQFATTGDSYGLVIFSALLLVKEKKNVFR